MKFCIKSQNGYVLKKERTWFEIYRFQAKKDDNNTVLCYNEAILNKRRIKKMEYKNKAVVLGANYYIGLSTIRCLGKAGVSVTAVDYDRDKAYGLESKYCKEIGIAPHYKNEPERFLSFLIDYAKGQEEKPVLIPTADPYVEFIDTYFDELKEYYLFPMQEKGIYTKLMDKDKFYQFCQEIGAVIPETVLLDEDNFMEKVKQNVGFPCMVKPADSPSFMHEFRQKMFKVHDEKELEEAVAKAKEKNIDVFIQRIIPGFDDHMYTFDAYINQEGEITHWTTCQKYRQYPINFGASVYTTQKYVKELYDIAAPFLKKTGFRGFAEIEFKKDENTGQFYIIEVNVRITNFNALLYKCGLNMPYITYREMIGAPLPNKSIEKDLGIVFWCAYEDMFAVRDYIKTKQLTPLQIAKSYCTKKAPAIWDIDDQKPFWEFNKQLTKRVLRKFRTKK